MLTARAFSPGHITGFFQICDEGEHPLHKGSREAGVSISQGVTTQVEIRNAQNPTNKIHINGAPVKAAQVSERVISTFLDLIDIDSSAITVYHEVGLPIGYGFGTSGAGALSLALALNEAFNLGLSKVETAQIAHIVEVECQTGLGTVIAESVGGIEIRVKPGGPGVGKIQLLPNSEEYTVACLPFGPRSTSQYLHDVNTRQRVNEKGGELTRALQDNPSVSNFMKYSRQFAEYIDLPTDRVKAVFREADEQDITCSTAIFGENVFCVIPQDQLRTIQPLLQHHTPPGGEVLIMKIDSEGARVVYG